jgi:hypothetical protein
MKKIFFILLLITAPLFCINNVSTIYAKQQTNTEKFINDIDTIQNKVDTSYIIVKKIGKILSQETKTYGLKKTIQINSPIFAPAFVFLVLFLLYLKGRKK